MTTNRFVIKLLSVALICALLWAFLAWRRAGNAMTIALVGAIPVLALALWPDQDDPDTGG